MSKKPCINCQKEIIEGLRFCPYCGTEQQAPQTSSNFDKNPFEILQVSPGAEDEVIKAAYKSLAKKYHPDVLRDGTSEERMKELNWAYKELSDSKKKVKWRKSGAQSPKSETRTEYKYKTRTRGYGSSSPSGTWDNSKGGSKEYHAREKGSRSRRGKTSHENKAYSSSSATKTKKSKRNNVAVVLLIVVSISIVVAVSILSDNNQSNNPLSLDGEPTTNPRNVNEQAIEGTDEFFQGANENGWELVFFENFSTNENGWFTDPETEPDSGRNISKVENGQLIWSGYADSDFIAFRSPIDRRFSDFKLSVEIEKVKGSTDTSLYGVFLKGDKQGAYNFVISDDYYSFFLITEDRVVDLVDWSYSSAINEDGSNYVEIKTEGSVFTVYVNNRYLFSVTDETNRSGFIGLVFGIYEEEAEAIVSFDNLRVEVPNNGEQEEIMLVSPTPVRTTPGSVIGCVIVSSLNIRKGPGTNFPVVGSIKNGECTTVHMISVDKMWAEVDKGWLFLDYLNITNGDIFDLPINDQFNSYPTATAQAVQPTKGNNNNPTSTPKPPTSTSMPSTNTPIPITNTPESPPTKTPTFSFD
jgi:curved DNA-binding protein CbpA